MAIVINEEIFIRGGGHSPADCVIYGNFSSTAGETQFNIIPGNPANNTVAEGAAAMTQVRFISFYCTSAGGDSTPYPVAGKLFDSTLQREYFFVSIDPADTTWAYKIEGVDNGLAPVV